jgi:hypothetical protein
MTQKLRVSFLGSRTGPNRPQPYSPGWQTKDVLVGVEKSDGKAGIIYGCVVAQSGVFADRRGRFDEKSLDSIIELWPAEGAPCHAQHSDFPDDGLLSYLGRMTDPRRSTAVEFGPDGQGVAVAAVRCDLVFDPAARLAPDGDLVAYFCERVKNDPASLSSSLVLCADVDERGYGYDNDGVPQPALWIPAEIIGSDLVAQGAAVGSLLGMAKVPDKFILCPEKKQHAPYPIITGRIDLFSPRLNAASGEYCALDTSAVTADCITGKPVFLRGELAGKITASKIYGDDALFDIQPEGPSAARLCVAFERGRLAFSPKLATGRSQSETYRRHGHALDRHQVRMTRDADFIGIEANVN